MSKATVKYSGSDCTGPGCKTRKRVDNIVSCKGEDGDEWQSIFLLDYKMPGTIDPNKWRNSLRYGSGEWTGEIPETQGRRSLRIQPWIRNSPIGNAPELWQQGHKYAFIEGCPIVSFFDFTALTTIQFFPETLGQPPEVDLSRPNTQLLGIQAGLPERWA